MSQSIDGHPLTMGLERSSHLEEYSRTRPASAGSRPRSLLNKVANAAAAAQLDEEPEPVDAEPWVLEGWGDGPSVSEASHQAALKLAPHFKNVPTTLVGLGGAPSGRRVLSAGPGGRSPLKASEARRKAAGGPGPPNSQADRRASGSQFHPPSATTAATVRRVVPPINNLEVGDESDGEPSVPSTSATAAGGGGAGGGVAGQARGGPFVGARGGPGVGPSARQFQSSLATQLVHNTPGMAAKLGGRRDATGTVSAMGYAGGAGAAAAAAAAATGSPGVASPASPCYRSLSAEAYHHGQSPGQPGIGGLATGVGGVGGVGAVGSTRGGILGAAAAARGSAGPAVSSPQPSQYSSPAHGHPPLAPHSHLEPLSPMTSRYNSVGSRGDIGPSSGPASSRLHVPRSSSFTSPSKGDHHPDDLLSHVTPPPPPPPQLPGLYLTGRKGASFRTETGLSGWDSEAPAMHTPGSPVGAGGSGGGANSQNVSLWIGPTAPSGGTSGLMVGAPSPGGSGRGATPQGGPPPAQPQRREQLAGSSRLQRGITSGAAAGGAAAAAAAAAAAGSLDFGLAPERSSSGPAVGPRSRAPAAAAGAGRVGSPDVGGYGFAAPQQDALTDFASRRSDLGSAGAGPNSGGGAGGAVGGPMDPLRTPPGRGGTFTGLLPPANAAMPMRVTALGKSPSMAR